MRLTILTGQDIVSRMAHEDRTDSLLGPLGEPVRQGALLSLPARPAVEPEPDVPPGVSPALSADDFYRNDAQNLRFRVYGETKGKGAGWQQITTLSAPCTDEIVKASLAAHRAKYWPEGGKIRYRVRRCQGENRRDIKEVSTWAGIANLDPLPAAPPPVVPEVLSSGAPPSGADLNAYLMRRVAELETEIRAIRAGVGAAPAMAPAPAAAPSLLGGLGELAKLVETFAPLLPVLQGMGFMQRTPPAELVKVAALLETLPARFEAIEDRIEDVIEKAAAGAGALPAMMPGGVTGGDMWAQLLNTLVANLGPVIAQSMAGVRAPVPPPMPGGGTGA